MHPSKEGRAKLPDFSMLRKPPDAVIISHSHMDHCGALPYFMEIFPNVDVYCTPPTLNIMDRMLHNCVSVMGKIKEERGIWEYPLYYHEDVEYAVKQVYDIPFNQEFAIHPNSDIRITFSNAGHVLGSASITISTPDHTVFYTADICTIDQELMPAYTPPNDPESIDTLIIESTYGATEIADTIVHEEEIERLGKSIHEVIERGGTALIPSFALGRAQEIINIVARLQDENKVPMAPVYLSGLGRAIYEIYDKYYEDLRPESILCPLNDFHNVGNVWKPEVVEELLREPSIIVATSGMMMENTPSAMIARKLVQDPKHGIFFTGYCAPDTLGATVKESKVGDEITFELNGTPVKVQLENIQSFHFSAHAPRKSLRDVVESIPSKNVIFVHGDPPALEWMEYNTGEGRNKYVPAIGQTIQLDA